MKDFDERIKEFRKIINESRKTVFFGGAGVSTESGIPDFRSKDGLYNQKDFEGFSPEYLLSHDCLINNPEVFYDFYRQKIDTRDKKPNITHMFLSSFEKKNPGKITIVTQNIDSLHQRAGSEKVLELHGAASRNYCTVCGEKYDGNYIFDSEEKVPGCKKCKKGLIRPDVTLYGEMLPDSFNKAIREIIDSDTMIVAGTSLTVYPAAGLVEYFNGKHLIILNREKTGSEGLAELVFHEDMGLVFKALEEGE